MSRLDYKKTQKEQHPLYNSWQHYRRKGSMCLEWRNDFYLFATEVGVRPIDTKLVAVDTSWPLSKNNFMWRKIRIKLKNFESRAAYQREYMKNNPDKQKNHDLKRAFGIDIHTYNQMQQAQNGLCAICGNPEVVYDKKHQKVRGLSVDHNHTTDQIRGLLCTRCNHGIGYFQEDPEKIKAAITYLEKHNVI